jgi:hypothetical protein
LFFLTIQLLAKVNEIEQNKQVVVGLMAFVYMPQRLVTINFEKSRGHLKAQESRQPPLLTK